MRAVPSPVLDRLGLFTEEDKDPNQVTVSGTEYVRARVKDVHHKTVLTKREGTAFEFKGLKVQNHYK
jgi:gibberellin 2-oxidase